MSDRILVWDLPLRIFHWVLAASFAGAFLTAESERVRDLHLLCGYTFVAAIAFRVVWGFVGSRHARFSALRFTVNRLHAFYLNPVDEAHRINRDFREFYDRLMILRREREGGMEGLLMAMATGYDYRKYQKVRAIEKKGKS